MRIYRPTPEALLAREYLKNGGYYMFWLSGKIILENEERIIKISKENYPDAGHEKIIDKKSIELMNHLKSKQE